MRHEKWKTALDAAVVLAVWAALAGLLWPSLTVNERTDIEYYLKGENPEGGVLAYPIGALAYFSFIKAFAPELDAFASAFRVLSLFWMGAVFWVYSKMYGGDKLIAISVIFAFLIYLVINRVEITAIALALLGAHLFAEGKRMAGWALVILGTFVKVFPVFLLPLFLIMELKDWRRETGDRKRKTENRIMLAALLGILLFFSSDATINAMKYRAAQGIQIESTYANALYFADMALGFGIENENSFGQRTIVLPQSLRFLVPVATVLQFAASAAVAALFFLEREKEKKFWAYAFLALAVAVFFGKINSTQFVMWSIAFAVPLMREKGMEWLYIGCVVLAIFTCICYIFAWDSLIEMKWWAVQILTFRNALLGVIILYVARNYLKSERA